MTSEPSSVRFRATSTAASGMGRRPVRALRRRVVHTGAGHSVPTLSLEGEFRRSHGSLYKALDDGHIDFDRSTGC